MLLHKDINNIESVQRCVACFVCGDYRRMSSVTEILETLHWPLLQDRREDKDLEMFYKIQKAMVNIPFPEELIKKHTNTWGHRQRYIQIGGSINAYLRPFIL